jgi:beta-glucosidase
VQLYLTDTAASAPVPLRSLRGVQRINLRPGETKRITFTLAPRDLTLIDDAGKRILEPGEFSVTVGGKQPGFKGNADAQTTGVVSGSFVVTGKKIEIP